MKTKKIYVAVIALFFAFSWVAIRPVSASVDTQFTQVIGDGTLSVTILDQNEDIVANPSVPIAGVDTHALCNTVDAIGSLGTHTQRVYVDNPGAAGDGWTLAIAATDGPTASWSSGSNFYDYNDPTDNGCGDNGDADSLSGQMTINSSGANVTLACENNCTSTGLSVGSLAAFEEDSVDAINLLTAASNSDNIWRGYLTDVNVHQTIPAGQAPGNYVIDMTLTVTAS